MTYNVTAIALTFVILAAGFSAEQQCGDAAGSKHLFLNYYS